MATLDLYQALVFYRERQLTEARLLGESALGFFASASFPGKAILCELLLARTHLDNGRHGRARAICLQAIGRLDEAETPALNYQAYFVLGLIEEEMGHAGAARDAYLKAHGHLESLRSHLRSEETKIAFLKDKLEVYEALVRMCLEDGAAPDPEAAFRYIEQAKSRSLADMIAFRAHSLPSPEAGQGQVVDQVRALREELNWYSRAIQLQESRAGSLRQARVEELRRSTRECERRLVEAMANAQVEDREWAALQGAGAIDLDAIRGALPDDSMLLQYYRVRDTFYACLLARRSLKIVPLGPVPELRRALQLLRFQLSKFRLGPDYVRIFERQLLEATKAHLRDFYRQLVAPIARDLDAGHLIIAPHDFLHYLPFHALLDGDEYLDSRYSVSYTPSASVYYLCSARRSHPAEGAPLVLGVPDPAAPQIGQEVRAVASVLPGAEVFLGEAATFDVLRERGARAPYIHIATHGWFRQDNPMFSSISLGTSQLSLFDLYQLHLPSELVTLSGCGTGLNVVVGGDEQMGLKRGLLYAGARGLLLTLWDVHDASTAEFMKLFYERLEGSANKAEALRAAMAEIRESYPHPFYWAPFVLVGKYS
jgi:CHAT domain-containing protein